MKWVICTFFYLFYLSINLLFASKNLAEIPKGNVLVVRFTQHRHLAALSTHLISTGTLKIIPHHGLIWETKHPFPNTLVIQKKGLFQIQDKALISLSQSSQSDLLFPLVSQIFEGALHEKIEGFDSEKIVSNQTNSAVKLTPKNDSVQRLISRIDIYKNRQISKIIIHRSQGNFDEIYLTEHSLLTIEKALSCQERGWFDGL